MTADELRIVEKWLWQRGLKLLEASIFEPNEAKQQMAQIGNLLVAEWQDEVRAQLDALEQQDERDR